MLRCLSHAMKHMHSVRSMKAMHTIRRSQTYCVYLCWVPLQDADHTIAHPVVGVRLGQKAHMDLKSPSHKPVYGSSLVEATPVNLPRALCVCLADPHEGGGTELGEVVRPIGGQLQVVPPDFQLALRDVLFDAMALAMLQPG